ncbi:hypothetical protein E1265_02070 [Streptomyces sp. 8K308]|nr:hypothetical protein E1265_02070 [Streptomyces sp. 8K308]
MVPSGLWRVAVALGVPSGFAEGSGLGPDSFPGPFSFYLIGLSIVAEALGLLALGLVRPWGEVVPGWVPWLGGRRVPVRAVVIPAGLGALVVTTAAVLGAIGWNGSENMAHPDAPDGAAYWVMTAAYAPLLLWGPLLAIVTVAYYRRRTRPRRQAGGTAWQGLPA